MPGPPATLCELVEQSEPEPRQTNHPAAILTVGPVIPGFGQTFIHEDALRKMVDQSTTFPGNGEPFVDTTATPRYGPKTNSEELDWQIFNLQLLIQLHDADYPNPEAYPALKPVKFRAEKFYSAFASSAELHKLAHIRLLQDHLSGSIFRREARQAAVEARSAKVEAMKTQQQLRYEAIEGTWPEPKFKSLDEYMNDQHNLSEKIFEGTVDPSKPKPDVVQPKPEVDTKLQQEQHHQMSVLRDMQVDAVNQLVQITEVVGSVAGPGLPTLRQIMADKTQLLFNINSSIASLKERMGKPQPRIRTPLPESIPEPRTPERQTINPAPVARPETVRTSGSFQGVKWNDVQSFTPDTFEKDQNSQRHNQNVNVFGSLTRPRLRPSTTQVLAQDTHTHPSASTTSLHPIQAGPTIEHHSHTIPQVHDPFQDQQYVQPVASWQPPAAFGTMPPSAPCGPPAFGLPNPPQFFSQPLAYYRPSALDMMQVPHQHQNAAGPPLGHPAWIQQIYQQPTYRQPVGPPPPEAMQPYPTPLPPQHYFGRIPWKARKPATHQLPIQRPPPADIPPPPTILLPEKPASPPEGPSTATNRSSSRPPSRAKSTNRPPSRSSDTLAASESNASLPSLADRRTHARTLSATHAATHRRSQSLQRPKSRLASLAGKEVLEERQLISYGYLKPEDAKHYKVSPRTKSFLENMEKNKGRRARSGSLGEK